MAAMTTPGFRDLARSADDLEAVAPAQFAALVKDASKADLQDLMADPDARTNVLNAVFSRMGAQYRGGRSPAQVVHWRILGRPSGGEDVYETELGPTACVVSETPAQTPDVTISLTGQDFLKLASGNAAPPMLFLTGKLKIDGDVTLAAALGTLFDIPKA